MIMSLYNLERGRSKINYNKICIFPEEIIKDFNIDSTKYYQIVYWSIYE